MARVDRYQEYAIVIPARNESESLSRLLPELRAALPDAGIVVVDDGSNDRTAQVCNLHAVKRLSHGLSLGNGAAIKTGARHVTSEAILFMDADGQHDPSDIPRLLERYHEGFDMVVGARARSNHASIGRLIANEFYNRFASWMTGRPIADLTSGFRVVNAKRFREFLHLLPNGFSYPTTITMAFVRAGYRVDFVPVVARRRAGKSHVRIFRDGLRFLIIIFKVGTLYSPLKIFLPVAAAFFVAGLCYYLYTYISFHRFTNMSALLLMNSVLIFLIGLVSEQITALTYSRTQHADDSR
jgi:glycosyltransferase involved in cell wall biosynthesis